MGVVQNIIGMVRDIHDRQENAHISDALKNNLNNPDAAVAAAYQINPEKGLALQDEFAKRAATQTAAQEAAYKAKLDRLGVVFKTLRGVPPEHVGEAFDRFTPLFNQLGVDPQALSAIKEQAVADPNFLPNMDEEAHKAMVSDQYKTSVATPGAHVLRGGKVIDEVPFSFKPVTVGSAQTGYTASTFDPNTGKFGPPSAASAPIASPAPAAPGGAASDIPATWSDPGSTTAALLPHFKQQESGGDYTAVSHAGALGAYQIMPATARELAKRVGVAWRPDMMHKDDPVSRKYQDALGHAAVQDAVEAGGGDLPTTFAYYHGGSDRSKWGPKTQQYVHDMTARVGGAGHATITPEGISVPAAPPKPGKSYRAATPSEVADAGYPAGTAAQIDQDGKFVNIHVPAKGAQTPDQARGAYQDAKDAIAELRKNISQVITDPDLGYATSTMGSVLHYIPGTSRQKIEGRIKQINTQKLISLVKALKAGGGNPFSRITNYEAQILPTTLGDFNLNQSAEDLKGVGGRALEQLTLLEKRLDEGAQQAGFNGQSSGPSVGEVRKGYRFKGGDPASPSSWEKVR